MTVTLKNRQVQIPNGFQFRLPEVGFIAPPFQSFDVLVNSVYRIIQANPGVAEKNKWPQNRESVAAWVDRTNANICKLNGWKDYIMEQVDLDPPKFPPPSGAHPMAAFVAGAKSLAEWFGDGMKPVALGSAEHRAAVCFECPLNQPGNWSNWFTRSASELIRKTCDLSTEYDKGLGVCSACQCPMRLKVFVPLGHILKNMPEESHAALDKKCWILKEEKCPPSVDKISPINPNESMLFVP